MKIATNWIQRKIASRPSALAGARARTARADTTRAITSPAPLPAIECVEPRVLFAVFVVTNTNNDGAGSLRQAITDANNTPNPAGDVDSIVFNIPGAGVHTITPTSPLPPITDAVTLDATGPDLVTPSVELNGSLAGADADGLVIASSDPVLASFVAGLIINNFSGNGVRITGNNNALGLSYIGTDSTGTAAGAGNGGAGVLVQGSGNLAANNVIAFNGGDGIAVLSGSGNDMAINNFFSNAGLAIDLGDNGVTPNDPGDADAGPNDLQNFPVLDKPTLAAGGGVVVTGTINTTPNTDVAIAFYTSPTADGEGSFRQQIQVHTDAAGNATFSTTIAGAAASDFITATATTLVFSPSFAITTSEFSAPVTAAVTPPPGDANNGHGNDPDHFDEGNPGNLHRHAHTQRPTRRQPLNQI